MRIVWYLPQPTSHRHFGHCMCHISGLPMTAYMFITLPRSFYVFTASIKPLSAAPCFLKVPLTEGPKISLTFWRLSFVVSILVAMRRGGFVLLSRRPVNCERLFQSTFFPAFGNGYDGDTTGRRRRSARNDPTES